MKDQPTHATPDSIPLATAMELTENFRALPLPLGSNGPNATSVFCSLRAFELLGEEIRFILEDKKAVNLRFYFGSSENPISTNDFRLIVVGVDKDGRDLYNEGIGDFSHPCPGFCDYQSPLMTGIIPTIP